MTTYSRQKIEQDDIDAVVHALQDSILTGGKTTEKFEDELARYVGSKYAVSFSSGTAALHSAYFAAGIDKTSEFITTPISFAATTNAGVYLGGKPKFVDINFDGNINYKKIEEKITEKTKAIVPIDYGGNPCNIEEIVAIGKKHTIPVIQDGAHSLGSTINNKKIGSIADMTAFSFHPVKPITTLEGGAVTTDNEEFYQKLKLFRSHGIVKKSLWNQDMVDLGFNYRLNDVACALGISQLKKLDSFIGSREKIANFYDHEIPKIDRLSIIKVESTKGSSRHLYPILLDRSLWCSKEDIFIKLQERGVGVQVHYKPIYSHSYYKKTVNEKLTNAEDFYRAEISIPCHQAMSMEEAKKVVQILKEVIYQNGGCSV